MAPVEFEKHIKEQLEKRRIKPSPDTWEKISARAGIIPKRKVGFIRYGIAAAVVGLMLSLLWIFNNSEHPVVLDQPVVEQPSEVQQKGGIKNTPDLIPDIDQSLAEDELNEAEKIEKEVESGELVQNNAHPGSKTKIRPAISDHQSSYNDPDLFINAKVSDVVAQVKLLEANKNELTEAEVDSLLWQAQKELMASAQFREKYEVDASSLLAGVEDELNQSFRDQVFEKLKEGFIKVRTAIADRNN